MRAEAQEFREKTRRNFVSASHPLDGIEATLANLKADVAILLSSVPVMNERFDAREARVAALEAGR
jgi:superfamily II DNA or RNA helicase